MRLIAAIVEPSEIHGVLHSRQVDQAISRILSATESGAAAPDWPDATVRPQRNLRIYPASPPPVLLGQAAT